jgi:hypothetical protein
MGTSAAGGTMAKKAGRPRTSTGEGPPVRIEPDLQSMLKYIAASRGIALSKLTSDLLRPVVEKEFHKIGQKLVKSLDEGSAEGRPR